MAKDVDLIRKIDFFEPLSERIIKAVADLCIAREYEAGEYIIRQGELGLGLFLIVGGCVRVEVVQDGHTVPVTELKEEDFFGELAILDNKPRSANVLSIEKTSCLLLTRDSFNRLMNKYPEVPIQIARALADRLRKTTEQVTSRTIAGGPPAAAAAGLPGTTQKPLPQASAAEGPATPPPADGTPAESSSFSKHRIRDFMVDTFSAFYTVKALTRFSAAIVGCPVRVEVGEAGDSAWGRFGDVQMVVFPAGRDCQITLHGEARGAVTAAVLRPQAAGHGSQSHQLARLATGVQSGQVKILSVPAESCRPPHFR